MLGEPERKLSDVALMVARLSRIVTYHLHYGLQHPEQTLLSSVQQLQKPKQEQKTEELKWKLA